MTISIEKEWAAVKGDKVIEKGENRTLLNQKLRKRGLDPDKYDIVALPKVHGSIFV